MAYIDNSETAKELIEAIRGNANTNLPPKQIANQVIPVIDINPKHSRRVNIVKRTSRSTTGGSTSYTTPTDKDFYLVGASLSYSCSAACDSNTYTVGATISGDTTATNILELRKETLTLRDDYANIMLNYPILLARGTNITVNQTFTAGTSSVASTIFGYTVEP